MDEMNGVETMGGNRSVPMAAATFEPPASKPFTIATISAGFEKGDFLVREEQGARIYFDFFEEAFNYIANKGYSRMGIAQEKEWIQLMNQIHDSVKGGMKYNTGTLLMVLTRPVDIDILTGTVASISRDGKKKGNVPLLKGEPGGRTG